MRHHFRLNPINSPLTHRVNECNPVQRAVFHWVLLRNPMARI